jgi:hypothetical protein
MSELPNPVDKIMLRPRTFVLALAMTAMVVGLVLGLVPVRVSTPDTATPGKVSCGNTLGGVETAWVAEGLGEQTAQDSDTLVAYIGICDRAIDARALPAWTVFFAGLVVLLWLGVVKAKASPGSASRSGQRFS